MVFVICFPAISCYLNCKTVPVATPIGSFDATWFIQKIIVGIIIVCLTSFKWKIKGPSFNTVGLAAAVEILSNVQEEEYLSGFGVEISPYGGHPDPYGARGRGLEQHQTNLTSELEGDKMVLKIMKPPRDKDSIASLSWQSCAWMVSVSDSRVWRNLSIV